MNDLITHCDEKAERFMRNGQWDLAKETYIGCHCLAASELTLRLATLEWRRDCALYIERTLDRPVPFDVFMRDISSRDIAELSRYQNLLEWEYILHS